MRWNYQSIPKLQLCSRWSLGMDTKYKFLLGMWLEEDGEDIVEESITNVY